MVGRCHTPLFLVGNPKPRRVKCRLKVDQFLIGCEPQLVILVDPFHCFVDGFSVVLLGRMDARLC